MGTNDEAGYARQSYEDVQGMTAADWEAYLRHDPEAIDAMRACAAEAAKPATKSERALRIRTAEDATVAFRELVSVRPGGRVIHTTEELAREMAALPAHKNDRCRVLQASIDRVRSRVDVTATEKLVFERVAVACMGELQHCFMTAAQIALEAGMLRVNTVHEAIASLTDKGLITSLIHDRRKFLVPALVSFDFETDGKTSRVLAERRKVVEAIGRAGVVFPHREAVQMARQLHRSVLRGAETHPPIDPPLSGASHPFGPPLSPKNGCPGSPRRTCLTTRSMRH